jgi:hypothetical protein
MAATGNLLVQLPAGYPLDGNTGSGRLLKQRRQLPVSSGIGCQQFFYVGGTTRQQCGNGMQTVNLSG